MVIGPTFLGAEPDRIDEGPHKGLRQFQTEEMVMLKLMQKLSPELQAKVTLSKGMDEDSLPAGRWNPFDERHLAGARQDNRVVPIGEFNTSCLSSGICVFIYVGSHAEGCPIKLFPTEQQRANYRPLQSLQCILSRTRARLPSKKLQKSSRRNVFRVDRTVRRA
jgi:hypothetical protein